MSDTLLAMTERPDDNYGPSRALSTGEFRAMPDASASTAQFQAFAENGGVQPGRPWAIGAPGRSVAKLALLTAAVVVVLVIIAFVVL